MTRHPNNVSAGPHLLHQVDFPNEQGFCLKRILGTIIEMINDFQWSPQALSSSDKASWDKASPRNRGVASSWGWYSGRPRRRRPSALLAASTQQLWQSYLPALCSCFKEILNIYHVLGEKRSGTGGNCVAAYEICLKSFHFPLVGKYFWFEIWSFSPTYYLRDENGKWCSLASGGAPEVVGVCGHHELSAEIAPHASKLQISFLFSYCFLHQNLPIANKRQWEEGRIWWEAAGSLSQAELQAPFVLDTRLNAATFAPSH